jgi:hypothetical protein
LQVRGEKRSWSIKSLRHQFATRRWTFDFVSASSVYSIE